MSISHPKKKQISVLKPLFNFSDNHPPAHRHDKHVVSDNIQYPSAQDTP